MSISIYSIWCFVFGKTFDLEKVADFGNTQMAHLDHVPFKFIYSFKIPSNMDCECLGLHFASPLIAASFQPDKMTLMRWKKMGLGGITFKTIMKDERIGNAHPRLAEVAVDGENHLLNALGLPGEGVETFVESIISNENFNLTFPIGFSIGGNNKQEYIDVFDVIHSRLETHFSQMYYELNISCPNTEDGKTLSDNINELLNVLTEIRAQSQRPIFVKISPDFDNHKITELGEIIQSIPHAGITAGNTTFRSKDSFSLRHSPFSTQGGGLSGPALFSRTLEMISLLKPFDLPIIATGGINTGEKAKLALDEGASLIGLATALVMDPYCIPKINHKLATS